MKFNTNYSAEATIFVISVFIVSLLSVVSHLMFFHLSLVSLVQQTEGAVVVPAISGSHLLQTLR